MLNIKYEYYGEIKTNDLNEVIRHINNLKHKAKSITLTITLESGITLNKLYKLEPIYTMKNESFDVMLNVLKLQDKILKDNIGKPVKLLTTKELDVMGLAVEGKPIFGIPVSLICEVGLDVFPNAFIELWYKNEFGKK